MKSAANRILVLMVVALCAVAVQAQSEKILKADVPFNFSIGDRQLTSGSYTITSMGTEVECWQDSNNQQTVMLMTIPDTPLEPVAPKLVFHRYGDQYVLAEVWTASAGHVVRSSKYEQKLAKSQKPTIVAVLLPHGK